MRIKVLILGDESQFRYHPVSNLEPVIKALGDKYEFHVTEDYPQITEEKLSGYDVCVNYIDNWEARGTDKACEALCSYVRKGGRMLVLHNGIITQKSPDLSEMQGGLFDGHDEYAELLFQMSGPESGTAAFALQEEPYRYIRFREDEARDFLRYRSKGKWYPAGWVLPCDKGKIVYIEPGHDRRTFEKEIIIQIIDGIIAELCSR